MLTEHGVLELNWQIKRGLWQYFLRPCYIYVAKNLKAEFSAHRYLRAHSLGSRGVDLKANSKAPITNERGPDQIPRVIFSRGNFSR